MLDTTYREATGLISFSFIKCLAEGNPKGALAITKGEESKRTPALDYGSLVDCLLTTPAEFASNYVIYEGRVPSDKLYQVAEKYVNLYLLRSENGEPLDKEAIATSARNEVGYDSRILPATFMKKFDEECLGYCEFNIAHSDKIIIDRQAYENAVKLVEYTKTSPHLEDIFIPNSNLTVLFQVPVYITTTQFAGKILLDCVVINHEKHTIRPIDFKTFEESFVKNYFVYKYYYQEAWYAFVLHCAQDESCHIEVRMPEELQNALKSGYEILQFQFVAIDKNMYRSIEIFESYPNIIEDVFFKGYLDRGDYTQHIRSISSVIEEAKYRMSIDNWTEDYQMLISGVKKIFV